MMAPAWAQGTAARQPDEPMARGLPTLGDAGIMTPLQERKLGDQIARELYRDPTYLDDPILGEYVDGIFGSLRVGARARGELPPELDERYAWQVLLGRDGTINAFALPGGYFGLHTGLLGAVASRDELASVLGHEMTHVTQRHIPRLLSRQDRQAPLMLAAMVLGAIAASRNPQIGAALSVGGQAAMIQQQLNFSRDMEREADRIGYGIMTQAGFAPEGFVSMFQKLQNASRINDNGDWPYLRGHPLTTQRIADMQQRQQNMPRHAAPTPDLETPLIAARARVLGRPGVDVLRGWAGEPDQRGFAQQPLAQRAGALYAAALANAGLRDLPRAQAQAAQLALAVAGDARATAQARLLQAELALQAGQPARVLELLPTPARPASAAPQSQAGRAALLLRAQAQTRSAQAAEATSALQTWLSDHPRDASAWQVMAAACAAQGQTLRQLRAEGEVQLARMDYAGAVDRWRAAQDFSRQQRGGGSADLIEASIVDTRLRQAQELLRQQERDEKEQR
ncbi:MAG: M48 family metalloprotease [Burkholderiaceae bacterium]|nr:M48 family metalloprotease [Burkholderiaceae bacterium]